MDTPAPSERTQMLRSWWRVAAVAAVFCLVVCAAMFVFHSRGRPVDLLNSLQISDLKSQLQDQRQNDQLKNQIRALDLEARRHYFSQLSLTNTGGWIALAALALFVVAAKRFQALQRKLPMPQPKIDHDLHCEFESRRHRLSVALSGMAVLILLLGIWFSVGTSLPTAIDQLKALPHAEHAAVSSRPPDFPSEIELQENWPRFRGFDGNGVSSQTNTLVAWDVTSGTGILWRSSLSGAGYNSPIVWNDRVFLSAGDQTKREVFCYHADSGKLLWQGDVRAPAAAGEEPWEMSELGGAAASTMTTDGRRVYAIFGNGDLAAFDLNGRQLWAKNLAIPSNPYGHASSLAMWQDRLIVQFDHGESEERKSRLYALDGATGRVVWQRTRAVPHSWATPIVINANNRTQIITLAVPWVISYAADDGAELWRADCLGGEIAPSPIFANGLVLAVRPNEKLIAIRPDGQGDVTNSHTSWTADEHVPDVTTPVSNGPLVFTLTTPGTLACFETAGGNKLWEHELDMEFQASPVIAGDRLYLFSLEGAAIVLQAGREFKALARSEMHEQIFATPAFANHRIFVRTSQNLYCVGASTPVRSAQLSRHDPPR